MSPPLLALLAGACAWAAYLSVGAKYLAYLGCALVAAIALSRQKRWAELSRDPGFRAAAMFWALTVVSVAWSTGTPSLITAQVWLYAMLLLAPTIALACPPDTARTALRQFGVAAAVVGAATALDTRGWLPLSATVVWHSTVEAHGNQRIVNSLVLALGAAICVLHLLQASNARHRLGWLLATLLSLAGLALQDRRTGMVALPVLLAALGIARLRSAWRGLAVVLLIAGLSAAAWQFSPGVRNRIDEGLHELRSYQSTDTAATSWGMRLRLAEHTLDMVREKPILGHGVGSWIIEWRKRVQPGLQISIHTTPHDEYLLVASQLGLVGIALLLWLFGRNLWRAWRAGPDGQAALVVWVAIAWTGLFNVVIRDSKFALPMLLMAGFAGALLRRSDPAVPSSDAPYRH
jgi:O-antigen ligase